MATHDDFSIESVGVRRSDCSPQNEMCGEEHQPLPEKSVVWFIFFQQSHDSPRKPRSDNSMGRLTGDRMSIKLGIIPAL